VRRIFYCAARRDQKAFLSVLASGRGPVKRVALRMMAPVVIKLATGLHRASDEAGHEDVVMLSERMDQIDAWLTDGVLGGEQLTAADYQIGVNVSALLLSDDLTHGSRSLARVRFVRRWLAAPRAGQRCRALRHDHALQARR